MLETAVRRYLHGVRSTDALPDVWALGVTLHAMVFGSLIAGSTPLGGGKGETQGRRCLWHATILLLVPSALRRVRPHFKAGQARAEERRVVA